MSYQEVHCSKRIMRFGLPVITALGILMGSTTLAAAQELPAVCDTDPAVCNLTAEQVNTIRLCEKMGEDSEACETAWQETTLPATCDTDPASCDLTAEEVKAIRVCEANPEGEECQWFDEGDFEGEDRESDEVPFNVSDKCKTDPAYCDNPGPAVFTVETGVLEIPVVKVLMPEEGLEERYEAKLRTNDGFGFMLEQATYLVGSEERAPLPENCDTDPASCGLTAEEVKAIRICETQGDESEQCKTAWDDLAKLCDTDSVACGAVSQSSLICEEKGHESEACEQAMMAAHKLPAECDSDPASCDLTAEEVKAIRVCEEKGHESEACEQAMMAAHKLPAECDTDPASCEMTAEDVKAIRACETNGHESEACEQAMMEASKLPEKCDTDPASCELTAEEVKAIRACETNGHESEACEQAMMTAHKLPPECDSDPASCDLTAEDVKAIRACEENPSDEACMMPMEPEEGPDFILTESDKCKTDPASCEHPGPAVLDEEGRLHLPVVKVIYPDGTEEHYEVIFWMDENSMMFFLEEVIFLDGESKP